MTLFQATAARPGPDGNRRRDWPSFQTLELRDAQVVGRPYKYLEGRAVPFETWANVGWFMEQHEGGSFKHSTKGGAGKTLPLLLYHDNRSDPIGHAQSWRHDDGGLDGIWVLDDSAKAQEAARMAEAGHLTGMSIGFQPIRSLWDMVDDWDPDLGPDHMDKVTRQESRLIEVSITPTPAFVEAQISQVRSASVYSGELRRSFARRGAEYDPDTWRRELDRLRCR